MTAQLDTTVQFDTLASCLTGALHLPGAPRYDALAMPWNVAVPNRPIAIVEAASAADVVEAVRFGAAHGVAVSVQATGHGAVASTQPTVQVNTSALRELAVDPNGRARIGAGLTWQHVIDVATPLGLAPLAGSSPHVGVVGFLTGGGIGPFARTYGVSSDYVVAFDVVTGDGELRRASETENPALFWGLRGGKGTLGIVTAVEVDLVALPTFFGGCLYFDGDDTGAVLQAWRRWTAGLPEQATSSVAVLRLPPMPGVPEPLAGKVTVAVRFAWVGDPAAGRQALAPIESAGHVVFGGVDVMPYSAMSMIHNDPVDPMPTAESSTLLTALTAETVDTVTALCGPQAECPQVIVELRHLGGALGRSRCGSSAFSHRGHEYSIMAIGIAAPPLAEPTAAHADALMTAMAPWTDGACLPNFQATADPAEMARKYDPATVARLASLADTYDPRRVIAGAAGIRAAAAR